MYWILKMRHIGFHIDHWSCFNWISSATILILDSISNAGLTPSYKVSWWFKAVGQQINQRLSLLVAFIRWLISPLAKLFRTNAIPSTLGIKSFFFLNDPSSVSVLRPIYEAQVWFWATLKLLTEIPLQYLVPTRQLEMNPGNRQMDTLRTFTAQVHTHFASDSPDNDAFYC